MWNQITPNIWTCAYPVKGIPASQATLIKLPNGEVLLYSPPIIDKVVDGEVPAVIKAAQAIGPVKHLLIPSNFHTLGMTDWYNVLGDAKLYAELSCAKRMEKFNLPFNDWRELLPLLPDGAVMEFAPLSFGEIWLQLPEDQPTLIVCEAFFNFRKEQIKGFVWVPATILDNGPGLKMSRIVKMMQTKPKSYGQWACDFLDTHQPTRLVPSHGDVIEDAALVTKLKAAVRTKIKA